VEKLIAKMQKKIAAALGDVDGGDEAIDGESTMPETGGAKEPTHSGCQCPRKHESLIPNSCRDLWSGRRQGYRR
jgi:hypothetical protein